MCAQTDDEPASPSDEQLRRAAEEILTAGEFQTFDHFERKPPPPSSTDTPAPAEANPTPEQQPQPAEAPWWERIRQRGNRKSSTGEKKSSTGESQPSSSDASESPSPQSGDASRPSAPPSARADEPARDAAPRRTGRENRPALRGSDGVERPVRRAAKVPRIRTENSSQGWEVNDGGFLSAFGNFLGITFHLIAYAVLAAVIVLILALAGRAIAAGWQGRSRRGLSSGVAATPLAHDRSPGETDADVFLQQALLFAGQRAYREALSQLLLGAMSVIESRDWIRYRRGLTVRDYLRSIRSHPEQFAGLKVVVDAYEPVEYGRQPATQPLFETALASYRDGFAAPPVT